MSKYFIPYKEESILEYPEDIAFIRKTIEEEYGILTCSNHKLNDLWRDFSGEEYEAGFLDPNEHFIEDFVCWLKKQEY